VRRYTELSILALAAVFEVGGDAVIRAGLRSHAAAIIALGFVALGSYGVVVNLVPVDFSKLLGTYVAFFALGSVSCGALVFRERVPSSTWIGLLVIAVGSATIQIGSRASGGR